MLPRQNRLKEKLDFDNIFKNGRKISTPFFLFAYIKSNPEKPTLIGIVASKKVGGAVQRNRAKRILRVASRKILEKYPKGLNISIVANSSVLKLSSAELEQEICNQILSRALIE